MSIRKRLSEIRDRSERQILIRIPDALYRQIMDLQKATSRESGKSVSLSWLGRIAFELLLNQWKIEANNASVEEQSSPLKKPLKLRG